MGLFRNKVHAILKHVEATTILGAEMADGRLTRLCYTGHASELSGKGVVQAIVPGGDLLWRGEFAEEDDVKEGHVAVSNGVVVTRVKHGKGHTVVGHDLWTGAEKWRVEAAKMVSRMGVEYSGKVVFITIDHNVHAIDIDTGQREMRSPVMTDQAADRLINGTMHPLKTFHQGSSRASDDPWSRIYTPVEGLEVFEREWAGTRELGVGLGSDVHMLGAGSYEGALRVGEVVVLAFRLDIDGTRHHHWYLYSASPVVKLGVMREDGRSEMFDHGHSVWTGKL